MLRGLYPYGGALTRPVTILLRNRLAHALARSALGAPERGAGSPNGLTEGFSCSIYGQTPPPHVRSAHLPFQGRHGRSAPGLIPSIQVLAKIRGYGRILSAPTITAAKPPTGRHDRRTLQWVVPSIRVLAKIRGYGRILSAPTGCVQRCSCLNVFIDFCEHLWYNIFIL